MKKLLLSTICIMYLFLPFVSAESIVIKPNESIKKYRKLSNTELHSYNFPRGTNHIYCTVNSAFTTVEYEYRFPVNPIVKVSLQKKITSDEKGSILKKPVWKTIAIKEHTTGVNTSTLIFTEDDITKKPLDKKEKYRVIYHNPTKYEFTLLI